MNAKTILLPALCAVLFGCANPQPCFPSAWAPIDTKPIGPWKSDIPVVMDSLALSADGNERILYRYSRVCDLGVEIARMKGQRAVWHTRIAPRGIRIKEYPPTIKLSRFRTEQLKVLSIGEDTMESILDLKTGNLVSKKVKRN